MTTIFNVTKTITATSSELQAMINAQRKASEFLVSNNQDTEAMALSFTSVATGVLGLVFWSTAPISIALGIFSVLTGVGAQTRQEVIDDVAAGYLALLETRNTLTNLGAVRVNATITSDRVNLTDPVDFLKKVKVNYMELSNGTKITF